MDQEIKITPEMFEAGVEALCAYEGELAHRSEFILKRIVGAVFLAMAQNQGKQAPAKGALAVKSS